MTKLKCIHMVGEQRFLVEPCHCIVIPDSGQNWTSDFLLMFEGIQSVCFQMTSAFLGWFGWNTVTDKMQKKQTTL